MKRNCVLLLTLALLTAMVPGSARAQEGIDEDELLADGWQKVSDGYWQRQTEDGATQSLAYGPGKQQMLPRLQAEMNRILVSLQTAPTAKKAEALKVLSGHMASLLSPEPKAAAVAKPPSCQPWNLDHGLFTYAIAPYGWHGILATASAWWDGGGLYCPGHIYSRASYAMTPVGGSTLTDLDWCAIDDNYAGSCWAGVNEPWLYPYSSCVADAYTYLTLFNGLYALDESKHWGVCAS